MYFSVAFGSKKLLGFIEQTLRAAVGCAPLSSRLAQMCWRSKFSEAGLLHKKVGGEEPSLALGS